MAYSYEATIPNTVIDIFERAFSNYMARLNFDHMSIGGRLGGHAAHEFRRDDHIVGLAHIPEGQSHTTVVVRSETVPVEKLVLDALTEGVADFLQSFCESLTDASSEEVIQSLIESLRKRPCWVRKHSLSPGTTPARMRILLQHCHISRSRARRRHKQANPTRATPNIYLKL